MHGRCRAANGDALVAVVTPGRFAARYALPPMAASISTWSERSSHRLLAKTISYGTVRDQGPEGMAAPPVHRAVPRALETLADDLATERQVSTTRITAPRGPLERFDQVVDAIGADIDAVPFEAGRRRVIAALEEEIADRPDQAIRHMAACTAGTRQEVVRALEAGFAEDEAVGPAVDDRRRAR